MASQKMLDEYVNRITSRYYQRTKKSKALFDRAAKYLPEGDTRAAVYFEPYPTFLVGGEGCHVFDADGNKYIDHLNNFTVQILGHKHPKVIEAASEQLKLGTYFGAPHSSQADLAELLCQRIPSLEKVRFCNSGTEATMFAIRAARAFTGKNKILKMEGIYHGTHDTVEASVFPSLDQAGDPLRPNLVPASLGVPKGVLDYVVVAPFNNIEATEAIIQANKDDLAAIIIEPVMTAAGVIPADQAYLRFLRESCHRLGVVLIFDEVVTLRLAPGGAQELFGVTPDLTAMGKFGGGGFAFGAFGGRREIMDLFSPKRGKISHSGTFNGHPVTMKAGLALLKELTPEVYQRLNNLGDEFRRKINTEVFGSLGLKAQAFGLGSISIIHYTDGPLHNYRDARAASEAAKRLPFLVHLCHLNNGLWIAERGEFALSTPMTTEVIDQTVAIFRETYTELRPLIEDYLPHLIK